MYSIAASKIPCMILFNDKTTTMYKQTSTQSMRILTAQWPGQPSVPTDPLVELRVPPSSLLLPPPLFSQCEAHGPPIGVGREKNCNERKILIHIFLSQLVTWFDGLENSNNIFCDNSTKNTSTLDKNEHKIYVVMISNQIFENLWLGFKIYFVITLLYFVMMFLIICWL